VLITPGFPSVNSLDIGNSPTVAYVGVDRATAGNYAGPMLLDDSENVTSVFGIPGSSRPVPQRWMPSLSDSPSFYYLPEAVQGTSFARI